MVVKKRNREIELGSMRSLWTPPLVAVNAAAGGGGGGGGGGGRLHLISKVCVFVCVGKDRRKWLKTTSI